MKLILPSERNRIPWTRYALWIGLGTVIALSLFLSPVGKTLDYTGYDSSLQITGRLNPQPPANKIAVITIDDASLAAHPEPVVLWYPRLARVIRLLADAGAASVALDIIPAISLENQVAGHDTALLGALVYAREKGTPVYLGSWVGGNVSPHLKFRLAASDIAAVDLFHDADGVVRSARTHLTAETADGKPLRLATFASILGGSHTFDESSFLIDYRIPPPLQVSFADAESFSPASAKVFSERQIYIGVTAPMLKDRYSTPMLKSAQAMPGVLIHALATATIQNGKPVRIASGSAAAVATAFLTLASVIFLTMVTPKQGTFYLAAYMLAIIAAVMFFFTRGIYWNIGSLILFPLINGSAVVLCGFMHNQRQLRHLKESFKSYINQEQLSWLMENPDAGFTKGAMVSATVMFTDIRGFTSLSERLAPDKTVSALNQYFEEMTDAVKMHGGYVNRFLGDGILAIFGAPAPLPADGAVAAVSSALEMIRRLNLLNSGGNLFTGNAEPLEIGIGIHTGLLVVGDVGCKERRDYTVIGDTVNLASRIEQLTKNTGARILVSEAVWDRVSNVVSGNPVTRCKVKGRDQEESFFEIKSMLAEVKNADE